MILRRKMPDNDVKEWKNNRKIRNIYSGLPTDGKGDGKLYNATQCIYVTKSIKKRNEASYEPPTATGD